MINRWQLASTVLAVAFATATFSVALSAVPKKSGIAAAASAKKAAKAAKIKPAMAAPSLASLQSVTAAETCDRGAFRLLIDVGHTAEAAGAVSARGMNEYQFNLTLARELSEELQKRGFARTALMITEGKTRPGLMSRVNRINKIAPDLMLSIHHDSVPDKLLEHFVYDDKTRAFSDRYAGHSIFVSAGNPHYAASVLFARTMGNEMTAHGLYYTPHYVEKVMGDRRRELVDAEAGVYRYDALLVLKNTRVPSVLLEAGSIINRQEEWKLRQAQYRAPIVASVSDAVDLYCRFKPPSATAVATAAASHLVVNPAAPVKVARKVGKTRVAARGRTRPVQLAHAGRR